MVDPTLLRQILLYGHRASLTSTARGVVNLRFSAFGYQNSRYATATEAFSHEPKQDKDKANGKWFTLPPYTATINAAVLGKEIACRKSQVKGDASASAAATTALKWVLRCCPELPTSLVHKLFRLRKVRRESSNMEGAEHGSDVQDRRFRRVAAKDCMNVGDRIFLPVTVPTTSTEKEESNCNEEEVKFLYNLVLYKDPAILIVNKPPGMPVQGGIGIKRSLDELAASCLSYNYSEPPRLVHRLDRDSSGILVMGRTQTSTSVLHSIFHEKTLCASKDDTDGEKRILEKKYWALVFGRPTSSKGFISAPLGKMMLDDGRSERIMVMNNSQSESSQHAITEYRVIRSFDGYSWLELSPLTGRKHQLRVHCAKVLGTPIVGDKKYGWQAHKSWKPFPFSNHEKTSNNPKGKRLLPFGLDFENGSITEKTPRLHLHCKQIVLPNVSQALQNLTHSLDFDLSELESLKLNAPLPSYMQTSWDVLNY